MIADSIIAHPIYSVALFPRVVQGLFLAKVPLYTAVIA